MMTKPVIMFALFILVPQLARTQEMPSEKLRLNLGANVLNLELKNAGETDLMAIRAFLALKTNDGSLDLDDYSIVVIKPGEVVTCDVLVTLRERPRWDSMNSELVVTSEGQIIARKSLELVADIAHPSEFGLSQNYPNPFNSETTIVFSLADGSENEDASLKIFDLQGREVKKFQLGKTSGGKHTVRWDGRDDSGSVLASGTYYYQLVDGLSQITKKLVLIK